MLTQLYVARCEQRDPYFLWRSPACIYYSNYFNAGNSPFSPPSSAQYICSYKCNAHCSIDFRILCQHAARADCFTAPGKGHFYTVTRYYGLGSPLLLLLPSISFCFAENQPQVEISSPAQAEIQCFISILNTPYISAAPAGV